MPIVSSVDYPNKRIYLAASTVGATIDTLDVYKELRSLRRTDENHRKFRPIVVAGGNVEKIVGTSATPRYIQLLYGTRIVPYNTSHTLKVVRDTFTDDGFAGRDCFDRTPLSPTVAVDIDIDFPEIELRYVSTGGVVAPTVEQIADAVLLRNIASGSYGGRTVRDALRAQRNRVEIVGTTVTIYAEDDTTVAWTATLTTAARDAIQSMDPA